MYESILWIIHEESIFERYTDLQNNIPSFLVNMLFVPGIVILCSIKGKDKVVTDPGEV